MSITENKVLVRRFYEEMLGPGNDDLFDVFVAEDIQDHRATRLGLPQGRT